MAGDGVSSVCSTSVSNTGATAVAANEDPADLELTGELLLPGVFELPSDPDGVLLEDVDASPPRFVSSFESR